MQIAHPNDRSMNSSSKQPTPQTSNSLSNTSRSSFSPFSATTLKVPSSYGFSYGAVWYCQRHYMIIACPLDDTMHFYSATTLLALKEREKVENIEGSIMQMSFHPETDTYIMECFYGAIYTYNASSNELKKLKKYEEQALKVPFMDWPFYAFSVYESNQLSIGNLENENVVKFNSPNLDFYDLHYLPKKNLLLASPGGGSVMIYRTDKLPRLPIIGKFQGERIVRDMALTQSFTMNGKEFVTTRAPQGKEIKIWHLVKGKMRLLKVVKAKKKIHCFVYLEDYKVIAVVYQSDEMEFFWFPSGKLERKLKLKTSDAEGMFLMKDKNMIGVTSFHQSEIEFVQLQ